MVTRSELESERELHVARVPVGRGAGDPAGVRVQVAWHADLAVRLAQVDLVEHVLRFHAELEVGASAEMETLEERRVHVPEAGATELVAAQVTERAAGRTRERAARGA